MLKTHNLSLRYGSRWAFRNVSLQLASGQVTSLVGPSGCGKSSLLACLNRLIELVPEARVTGEIEYQGQSILGKNTNLIELRRKMGMIFQRPNPFPVSIWKNLTIPLRELGRYSKSEIKDRTEKALRDVELWGEVQDRLHSSALKLSGGQQQRLCIARALALEPEVLLMDEPCSALDPISSSSIEDLIVELKGRYTVLIVTHNLAQAKRISDATAVFWFAEQCGQLVEFGSTQQLFDSPSSEVTSMYFNGLRG